MNQFGNFQEAFADPDFISITGSQHQQPYFHKQAAMQSLTPDNGGGFSGDDYQPDFGFNNNNTYIQNQTMTDAESPGQYTPPPAQDQKASRLNTGTKAAEIKAKLMMAKERSKSGTPITFKPAQLADASPSQQESPQTPSGPTDTEIAIANSNERSSMRLTDEDFADLISGVTAFSDSGIKREDDPSVSCRIDVRQRNDHPSPPNGQRTQNSSFRNNSKLGGNDDGDERLNRTTSARLLKHAEETSEEGELHEESAAKAISTGPKDSQPRFQPSNFDEQVLRNRRDDEAPRTSQRPAGRAISPRNRSRSPPIRTREPAQRYRDDRYDDVEETLIKKNHASYKSEYTESYEESKPRPYQRRDSRDFVEDNTQRLKYDKKEKVPTKPVAPTLEELIAVDEDLRDWLLITDYHNVEKRTRTLNRRRALAKLDADRARLLEEEEEEERGGSKAAAAAMLPPVVPVRITASAIVTPTRQVDEKVARANTGHSPVTPTSETASKRSYSDYQDTRDAPHDNRAGKITRYDDRGRGAIVKSDRDATRPISRGRQSPRHRSASPPVRSHGWDDKTLDGRGRDFGSRHDRERSRSPGLKAYESRGLDRSFSGSDEHPGRARGNDRPFVERGGYRGRAYDPNHHLKKGRGRGATNYYTEPEPRPEPRAIQGGFGARIADMNPYRDPVGIDKGGRGDTRYFVVKSFNEQNVIRCIDDSIWTTQAHNGEKFKQAFLTCKHVILVFSINQSHAFQGYARMESLPGSEKAPSWQKNLNWESAGAFKVRWLTITVMRFARVHHLKNSLNENMAVLVAKDGQEIEEKCGADLVKCIDEEFEGRGGDKWYREPVMPAWDPR